MQSATGSNDSHARGTALAGMVSLVGRNTRKRERLLQWLQQTVAYGAHLHDIHVQAEAARALFGASARELTLDLVSGELTRAQARRELADEVVACAARVLIEMQEGEQGVEEIHRELSAELAGLGPLGDVPAKAAQSEQSRLRPPTGFTAPEWSLLQEAPLFAVLHVSAAATNGPRELLREFREADRTILCRSLEHTRDPIVGSAFHAGMCRHRLRQLADNYPSRRALLNGMQNCVAIAEKIGTAARAEYAHVINEAAAAAVQAACERVLFSRRAALETERRALNEIDRLTH
ncbi:hypothetical protein [Povalibacter sp.]|uniref:hypothetical protein n=1 Tax=Povalibacter sp. TaxID=1962978 RepID=UPI002F3E789B